MIKVNVTEDHFKLLRNLSFMVNENGLIVNCGDGGDSVIPPFGTDDKYEGINLILNGNNEKLNDSYELEFSDEEKKHWDSLYSDLPYVLEIVLQYGKFETGGFKRKWYDKKWTKFS